MTTDRSLTQEERDFALLHLTESRDRMLAALDLLTPAQWNFKPVDGAWSVAECCEHVALVESAILQRVLDSPELADLPELAGKEHMVLQRVSMVVVKATAPETARPQGRWPVEELLGVFTTARQTTMDFTSACKDPLRWKVVPHFALGPLDGYQWLIFLAAHSDRHRRQLEAVKALPDFPKTGSASTNNA